MKNITAALLGFFFTPALFAQSNQKTNESELSTKLDAYIKTWMNRVPEVPGIAIVVVKDDKPVFLKAYGYADLESGKKADPNTLFYIASSTKSFTGLAAALLDREKKILFNEPINRYMGNIVFKNPVQ